MTPRRLRPGDPDLDRVLALLRGEFAYMDGVVDPPSSIHRATPDSVAAQARDHEVWVIGDPVMACVFLTLKPEVLYLGKLAVAGPARGQGLARRLTDLAIDRARVLGRPMVELESRVELAANHLAFEKMGFLKVGETAHPGYDRPTSYTFRRTV